ncbi:MAG: M50 family metallopeptidase [Leptospiraceae bacterium]|nr:M50 family metallopeptidase [Leptospiraceae bacterium]
MKKNTFEKLFFLFSIIFAIISAWNFSFMQYWKDLVVLTHEIFHAISSLLTGGTLAKLTLHGNESGETIAVGIWKYSMPIVYSAGYLGCALLGGFQIFTGFQKTHSRVFIISFGFFIILSTLMFSNLGSYTFYLGIFWGIFFFIIGLLGDNISSFTLVFFGTAISFYSIYDLGDFMRNLEGSDAGKLAIWITQNFSVSKSPENVSQIGYYIAIFWSSISISLILIFLKISLFPHKTEEDKSIEKVLDHVESGKVNEDVAEWFLKRGLDLDGRPLSKNIVDEINKKGF